MRSNKTWRIVVTLPAGSVDRVQVAAMTSAVAELLRATVPSATVVSEPTDSLEAATMTSQQAADHLGVSVTRWRAIAASSSLEPARVDRRGSRDVPMWRASDVYRVAADRAANPPKRGRRSQIEDTQ